MSTKSDFEPGLFAIASGSVVLSSKGKFKIWEFYNVGDWVSSQGSIPRLDGAPGAAHGWKLKVPMEYLT